MVEAAAFAAIEENCTVGVNVRGSGPPGKRSVRWISYVEGEILDLRGWAHPATDGADRACGWGNIQVMPPDRACAAVDRQERALADRAGPAGATAPEELRAPGPGAAALVRGGRRRTEPARLLDRAGVRGWQP